MKKEEKTELTKRRILNGAIKEFGTNGYKGTTINSICDKNNIPKGLIYHNFKGKDDIFLACVEQNFKELVSYLNNNIDMKNLNSEEQLRAYLTTRLNFFHLNPLHQRIFCDAIIFTPSHLQAQIENMKKDIDGLNKQILSNLLSNLNLRSGINKEIAIEIFSQYQDFINAKYHMIDQRNIDFKLNEEQCYKAINILLYGIVESKKEEK